MPRDVVAIVFDAAAGTRAFSAGVAVEEHLPETVFQMLDSFHSIFRLLTQISKPAIAVVDGPALGGGCELVAGCDIVIASDRAVWPAGDQVGSISAGGSDLLRASLVKEGARNDPPRRDDRRGRSLAPGAGQLQSPAASSSTKPTAFGELRKTLLSLHDARRLELGAAGGDLDSALEKLENFYLNDLMKTEDAQEGVRAFMESENRFGGTDEQRNDTEKVDRTRRILRVPVSPALRVSVLALRIAGSAAIQFTPSSRAKPATAWRSFNCFKDSFTAPTQPG
jgi:cyclohexa-1,5-dienecarbonyl-CoA hydratase